MRTIMAGLVLLVLSMQTASVRAQSPKYPPLSEYMMTPEAETALARSAAPENVSAHATVKVLTAAGYKVAAQGDNGFVCIVMRGWGAPTFTPAPFRDLVYYSKAPCANLLQSRRQPHRFAVAGAARQARNGRQGTGPNCRRSSDGIRQRRAAKNGSGGVRVHVLCGPGPGAWSWPVASSHDVVHPVLRELDAGR